MCLRVACTRRSTTSTTVLRVRVLAISSIELITWCQFVCRVFDSKSFIWPTAVFVLRVLNWLLICRREFLIMFWIIACIYVLNISSPNCLRDRFCVKSEPKTETVPDNYLYRVHDSLFITDSEFYISYLAFIFILESDSYIHSFI